MWQTALAQWRKLVAESKTDFQLIVEVSNLGVSVPFGSAFWLAVGRQNVRS